MTKKTTPLKSKIAPRKPRKSTVSKIVVNRYIDLGDGSGNSGTQLTQSQLDSISRVPLLLPSSGTNIAPGEGFSFMGRNYANNTANPITLILPSTHQDLLNQGFEESLPASFADNYEFNKIITTNTTILSQEVSDSDQTYGISAKTASGQISVEIPASLPDETEIRIENTDGINDLSVFVTGQLETIDGDSSGIIWSEKAGIVIKRQSGSWIVVSKYKS